MKWQLVCTYKALKFVVLVGMQTCSLSFFSLEYVKIQVKVRALNKSNIALFALLSSLKWAQLVFTFLEMILQWRILGNWWLFDDVTSIFIGCLIIENFSIFFFSLTRILSQCKRIKARDRGSCVKQRCDAAAENYHLLSVAVAVAVRSAWRQKFILRRLFRCSFLFAWCERCIAFFVAVPGKSQTNSSHCRRVHK